MTKKELYEEYLQWSNLLQVLNGNYNQVQMQLSQKKGDVHLLGASQRITHDIELVKPKVMDSFSLWADKMEESIDGEFQEIPTSRVRKKSENPPKKDNVIPLGRGGEA